MSVYKRIISDDQVEDAVMDTLKLWLSDYLTEVEQQRGLQPGFYARPQSWEVRNDMDKWPEEALPSIIVIGAGFDDEPRKQGGGKVSAPFSIGVAAVVSSIDQVATRRMAYRYGAAIRTCLLQQQSLGQALDGTVNGVTLLAGRNNELPQPEPGGRTIWATRQVFAVDVAEILTQGAGPTQPSPVGGVPANWGRVEQSSNEITLTKESVNP